LSFYCLYFPLHSSWSMNPLFCCQLGQRALNERRQIRTYPQRSIGYPRSAKCLHHKAGPQHCGSPPVSKYLYLYTIIEHTTFFKYYLPINSLYLCIANCNTNATYPTHRTPLSVYVHAIVGSSVNRCFQNTGYRYGTIANTGYWKGLYLEN
jgi:hypothetical protein